MTMHLAFLCVLQQLVVAPHPAEVGQEVVVRLEATAGGEAGIPITVALPAGERQSVGVAGVGDEIRFTPGVEGRHVFSAELDGVRLVAPVQVVAARQRWPYAIVCVPLGIALMISILRLWAADRRSARAQRSGTQDRPMTG